LGANYPAKKQKKDMGKLLLAKLINQETNKKKVENLDRQKQGTGEPTCFASHNQVTLNSEEIR